MTQRTSDVNVVTNVRVDVDLNSSAQLETVHRILHFLVEMRNAGWVIELDGHLTGTIHPPVTDPPAIYERKEPK